MKAGSTCRHDVAGISFCCYLSARNRLWAQTARGRLWRCAGGSVLVWEARTCSGPYRWHVWLRLLRGFSCKLDSVLMTGAICCFCRPLRAAENKVPSSMLGPESFMSRRACIRPVPKLNSAPSPVPNFVGIISEVAHVKHDWWTDRRIRICSRASNTFWCVTWGLNLWYGLLSRCDAVVG
jgi:hypothetical protein